jgi:hypothetical protein
MRICLSVRGVIAHVDLPSGWPAASVIVTLPEALAETARECPSCPDVHASAFVLAIAAQAPPELATSLRDLAAKCD